jgi:hypothetical protein
MAASALFHLRCVCREGHQNCFCFLYTTPSSTHIPEMPYWGTGKAWRQGKPEERKSRRIVLIRHAWQHVVDFEDWIYPIHTLWHDQRSIMYGFHHLRRWGDQPLETTQVRLSLMD